MDIYTKHSLCYLSGLFCSCIWWAHIYKSDITIEHLHKFSSGTQVCPSLYDPWTVARQDSLSFTNSWSFLKFMPIESVMTSNHLILYHPLLLLLSIFPSIRVFSNESVLCIRWLKKLQLKSFQ